jgi:hypothetical protein
LFDKHLYKITAGDLRKDPEMARAQEVWRVRVCGSDGAVYGAGVLVAGCSVLTCAHVVQRALGVKAERVRPGAEVDVDLPMSPQHARHRARIAADGWIPARDDHCGDLAVLTLPEDAVSGTLPAVVRICGPAAGRRVRLYGHPLGLDQGTWVSAVMRGTGGPAGEWIQLDAVATGHRITAGFSGAGIVEEASGDVIGLLVAEDLTVAARVGWMVPLECAARHWPPLAALLAPPDDFPGAFDDGTPQALRRSWLFGVVECCLRVPVLAGQAGRDRVVGQLRPGIAAVAERYSQPRMDLHGIVAACLAYEGGLAEFVEVVGGFEGGSLPMRDLRQAVDRIPRGAVA